MREFFHGWRRKVGCVTLLMALVLTVGWMRSRIKLDAVYVPILDRVHVLASVNGEFAWLSVDWLGYDVYRWKTYDVTEITIPAWSTEVTLTDVMERVQRGLDDDGRMRGEKNGRRPRIWIMSYRFTVLALTLLSAWLILAKRQQRPQLAPGP